MLFHQIYFIFFCQLGQQWKYVMSNVKILIDQHVIDRNVACAYHLNEAIVEKLKSRVDNGLLMVANIMQFEGTDFSVNLIIEMKWLHPCHTSQ